MSNVIFSSQNNRPNMRLVIILAVLVAGAVIVLVVPSYGRSSIPERLVGKWEGVQGSATGITFEFKPDGKVVGRMNMNGRRGVLRGNAIVRGNTLQLSSINPITRKMNVTTHTLKSLTDQELVLSQGASEGRLRRVQ